MGWYFTHGADRAAIVAEVVREWGAQCLAHQEAGNNLWLLIEGKHPETKMPIQYVALAMLEGSPTGWGYKPLDETCGPSEVNCPLGFIDAVEKFPPMAYAAEWRKRVRAYHAAKTVTVKAYKACAQGSSVVADTARAAAQAFFAQHPARRKCDVYEGEIDGPFFVMKSGRLSRGEWPKSWKDVTKKTLVELPA